VSRNVGKQLPTCAVLHLKRAETPNQISVHNFSQKRKKKKVAQHNSVSSVTLTQNVYRLNECLRIHKEKKKHTTPHAVSDETFTTNIK
jgi:hypothetical protein